MDWLQALLMGLVQGLTEFLPVSSSGHLQIAQSLLGVQINESATLTFDIIVHAATVLATIFVFWKDIVKLLEGLFKFKYNEETDYIFKLCVSMIPVFIVGMFFKDQVEGLFSNSCRFVGCMLLITSLLLAFSYFFKPKKTREISYLDAFIIGVAQAIAVIPGISRSGSTISTGMLLGNNKQNLARFSFLMVLVPILGQAFLSLVGGEFTPEQAGISLTAMLVGFFAAFLSGLFACKVMVTLVARGKLIWFAVYCVVIGVVAIIFG